MRFWSGEPGLAGDELEGEGNLLKNTGLPAASGETEEGVGRNDTGVLRDLGKTSFSGNKSMRGVDGRGLIFASFFTSSLLRPGRNLRFEAVLCADDGTRGLRSRGSPLPPGPLLGLLLGLLPGLSMFLFSLSSAHSSAASKYAGENDGLVLSWPLLVSLTSCRDPSTITARFPGPCLPL